MDNKLQEGDEVCHKSNKSICWVIDELIDTNALCSRLDNNSKKVQESFNVNSLEKYSPPGTKITVHSMIS